MQLSCLLTLLAVVGSKVAPSGENYSAYSIGKTLFSGVLEELQARHTAVAELAANDTDGWSRRRGAVRRILRRAFAPLAPETRSAPRSVVTGTLRAADGSYLVEKLLVESRPGYWISAGLWIPTNSSETAPVPAVLAPSGHDGPAWRDPGSQIIAFNLVSRGFAVLGLDPIGQGERSQLPDLDGPAGNGTAGTEHYGCSFEHEYVQRQATLLGVNAASAWLWDLVRLVDFVSADRRIDGGRIGVAGCSGGGVQAAYLGALDPRIGAASIACYTSTLAVDYKPSAQGGGGGPAEGEQQWGPFVGLNALALAQDRAGTGTRRGTSTAAGGGGGGRTGLVAGTSASLIGLDKPDLLVARAPLPTQVLLTDADQYFPLEGGKAAVAEAAPAFSALAPMSSAASPLTCTVGHNTHGYVNSTRLALYAFMQAQLRGVERDSGVEVQPAKTEQWTYADLCVTSNGYVNTAPEINNGSGSVPTHEAFIRPIAEAAAAALRAARSAGDGGAFLERVRRTAAEVVGCHDDGRSPATPLSPTPVPASAHLPNGTARYLLPAEGRCRVALDVLPPDGIAHPVRAHLRAQAVLYVSRKGASIAFPQPGQLSAAEWERVNALRAAGLTVILVDVCGFGVAADSAGDAFGLFDLPSFDFRVKLSQPVDAAFNLNRSVVGVHAADVMRAARAVSTAGALLGLPGAVEGRLHVLATIAANETAAAVLSAAVISQRQRQQQQQPPLLGGVALLGSVASWQSIAMAPRYSMVAYYSFVFGALRHFDMTDLAAALAPTTPVLIGAPLGAGSKAQPAELLNASAAAEEYAFALRQHPRLEVVCTGGADGGGTGGLTTALVRWIDALTRA